MGARGATSGVLRRDRPHGPDGPGAATDRRQACPGAGEGVPARPGSSPRTASTGTPITGTPQGGILSPLLANIALSVLDEHFAAGWEAHRRPQCDARQAAPRTGWPTTGSSATRTTSWSWSPAPATHAEALRDEVRRCSPRWACACRRRRRGSATSTRASTSSAGASSADREARHRQAIRLHLPVEEGAGLDHGQGADAHPQSTTSNRSQTCCTGSTRCCGAGATTSGTACPSGPSATSTTSPVWRIVGWLRKRHPGLNMAHPGRRYLPGWWIRDGGIELFRPDDGRRSTRYRYRGTHDPHAMDERDDQDHPHQRHEHVESRMRWKSHVRFGGRAGETHRSKGRQRAPVRPLHRAPDRRGRLYLARSSDACSPPGRRLVDRRPHARPNSSSTRSGWPALRRRTRRPAARFCTPITDASTRPGRSGNASATPGCSRSMGTIGDCYDNSMIESFWGTMQLELLDSQSSTARHTRPADPTPNVSSQRGQAQSPLPERRVGRRLARSKRRAPTGTDRGLAVVAHRVVVGQRRPSLPWRSWCNRVNAGGPDQSMAFEQQRRLQEQDPGWGRLCQDGSLGPAPDHLVITDPPEPPRALPDPVCR